MLSATWSIQLFTYLQKRKRNCYPITYKTFINVSIEQSHAKAQLSFQPTKSVHKLKYKIKGDLINNISKAEISSLKLRIASFIQHCAMNYIAREHILQQCHKIQDSLEIFNFTESFNRKLLFYSESRLSQNLFSPYSFL